VLTHYRSLGTHPAPRQALYQQPSRYWRDPLLAELSVPHPYIAALTTQIDLVRYGHAMAVPVPGVRSNAALATLASPPPTTAPQRLHFAHSDLSGYSIFEEAFTHGHRVGSTLKTP
jgi:hypothetical protein